MSSRIEPRRRAEKPKRRAEKPARPATPTKAAKPAKPAKPARPETPRRIPRPPRPVIRATRFVAWLTLTLAGVVMLAVSLGDVQVDWLPGVGAVIVATTYTWALCARTGGRPWVYSAVALALGLLAIYVDRGFLRGGAAVGTAVLTGVLAVMATVPAARFAGVVREVLIAVALSLGGALAVVGFEPRVSLERFEYTSLGIGVLLCLGIVYRLGAGLHGLGRRGLLIVVIGSVLLGITLVYAETLRHYGSPGLVEAIDSATAWSRDHLGSVPRPIQFVLGIPALVWGVHMRARRRQGWWVCAFAAAGMVSLANTLVRPRESLLEAGLSVGYSLALGLLIGYAVIRLDLALTGPRGARARRAEEAAALRPEPRRTSALL